MAFGLVLNSQAFYQRKEAGSVEEPLRAKAHVATFLLVQ